MLGVNFNHPILFVHIFSFTQLTLWTINGVAKALEASDM
jgi:hypothetical protein